MLFRLIILIVSIGWINCDLPTELDPFLEKLFEFEECEEFISSADYTNVATSKCDPHVCDFPRQLCARPASKFQDNAANTCRNIPNECLTAANGGVPVRSVRPATPKPFMPLVPPGGQGMFSGGVVSKPSNPMRICTMDAPTGRFCGFRPMYTYNKETFQCDEFWFPGCRTSETNANLFDDYQECQKIADMCKPKPTTRPPPRPTPQPPRPTNPRTAPKPTTPPTSPIVDVISKFGGGGAGNNKVGQGALGAIGMFTGSGLGETGQGPLGNFVPNPQAGNGAGTGGAGANGEGPDLGLFGLIQQGIMGAQAAGKGGNGGKEAASKAAGQILQQFTGFDLGGLGNNFGGLFG
ncbi:unnamed protein product [Caenorhabditis bovis]|uniref:BPTI/Kunitz inhibitor domain-containing protein n=1 Tax=Caenorhabditis bovis TaxID=2654633 RepID=A0A8S1E7I1_9PELO|nr:unnamed protein product [Caenorhabditis bovis]